MGWGAEWQLRARAGLTRAFSEGVDDPQVLLPGLARALSEAGGDIAFLRLVGQDRLHLEPGAGIHHPDPEVLAAVVGASAPPHPVGEGLLGSVAANGRSLLVPSIDPDQLGRGADGERRAMLERLHLTSLVAVPLAARGVVLGVLALLRSDASRPFDDGDLRFLEDVAGQAGATIAGALDRASRQQSEAARELLFEASPLPLFVFDVETLAAVAVNEETLRLFGYAREEFLGMDVTGLAVQARTESETRKIVAGWGDGSASGMARYRRKSGSEFDGEFMTRALAFEGRRARIAVLKDVTDREKLRTTEEQLRQAQKMEAVGRLAGGIAHDFNNVLSVILSYAQIVTEELRSDDALRADMQEIRAAATRAAELTHQLLLFSRHQVLQTKVLDLNAVVARMPNMLRRLLGEDIDLVFSPAAELGRIRADVGSLEQVIMNLAVNARDAMPSGGQLTLETGAVVLDDEYARTHLGSAPGPHAMLAISDTGTGMDRETQARIFEPFFTTKAPGKGTGLGLSTVFGIVQQFGGSVWVYSEVGRGTTFKVYLPVVEEEAPTSSSRLSSVPPAPGTETILLVEDQEQVRVIAKTILERHGYRVVVASGPADALALCTQVQPIHLLLTDVVMPQMSGAELARRVLEVVPHIRVLCMSGYADDSVVRHGVLDGGMAFLQKPFTPTTLTRKVRETLAGG